MTRTQIKEKIGCSIPTDKILEYNEKEFRRIANNQIKSLKEREKLTGKRFYIYYINEVILKERGEVS